MQHCKYRTQKKKKQQETENYICECTKERDKDKKKIEDKKKPERPPKTRQWRGHHQIRQHFPEMRRSNGKMWKEKYKD